MRTPTTPAAARSVHRAPGAEIYRGLRFVTHAGLDETRGSVRLIAMPVERRNVLGGVLQPCSTNPMTGFFRDGCCRTGRGDVGVHVVCARVTEEFLAYSKAKGND